MAVICFLNGIVKFISYPYGQDKKIEKGHEGENREKKHKK